MAHTPPGSEERLSPDIPVELPYRLRDDFLSPAESSFYHLLKKMVAGHLVIFPKISLGEIFFVTRQDISYSYYNKINREHVDFLLCKPKSLKPVFAIELDDSSHQHPDRVERDLFVNEVFRTARLPLVRVPARRAYDMHELAALFKESLQTIFQVSGPPGNKEKISTQIDTPCCPKCGVPMVLRTASRGMKAGGQFYGCPNFPRCREIISITSMDA